MQTTIKDVLVKIKDHLNRKKGDNVFASLAPIKKDGQDNEEDVTITLFRIDRKNSNNSDIFLSLFINIFNIKITCFQNIISNLNKFNIYLLVN